MARLHLSFSGQPGAIEGIGFYELIVSVINGDGTPRKDLVASNFRVVALVGLWEEPLKSLTLARFGGQGNLPNLPGVYALSVKFDQFKWSNAAKNSVTLHVTVQSEKSTGQALYCLYSGVDDYVHRR